jgi:hypothetical protein
VTLTSSDTYFGARRLAVLDQSSGSFFPWVEAKGGYDRNFATYWQDSAGSLDYANNRYYSNAYGRFTRQTQENDLANLLDQTISNEAEAMEGWTGQGPDANYY